LYINGHDHCLEHISSRDRYGDERYYPLILLNMYCISGGTQGADLDMMLALLISSSLWSARPIQHLTSGGGSKAWRGVVQPNEDRLRFFYDGQGFMSLQLDQDRADLAFYDVDGNVLCRYSQRSLRKKTSYLLQHSSFFFPFCSAVCVNLNVVALWSAAEVEDQNANVLVLGLWSI
jgi:hypothetical protein